MTTTTILLLLTGGFVLLISGAELLVRGAARLAIGIGISPLVIGMTVVAYGTSAPEVAVTVQSVYADPPQPDLAIGNVVGSNISNILLVLGIAAVFCPLVVSPVVVRAMVPFMILVTGLVWYFCLDGTIGRLEGLVLLVGAVAFTVFSIARSRRRTAAAAALQVQTTPPVPRSRAVATATFNLCMVGVGLGLLVLGARWLVDGATEVARLLQVSELIVGLTVVAVGTSLPEIATSLIATIRGHGDMAVGNVVGSNVFNLLLVLGLCATVAPQSVIIPPDALRFDIPIMLAVAAACWPIFYTDGVISRRNGLLFLSFYVAYIIWLWLQATQHAGLVQYRTAMGYFVLPFTILMLGLYVVRYWLKTRRPPDAGQPTTSHE